MKRTSYAIWWKEDGGPRRVGKLEIARLHALFSGNGNGRLAVSLDQITAVDYSRGEVLLGRKFGTTLRIGSLDAPGVLREVATRLAAPIQSD